MCNGNGNLGDQVKVFIILTLLPQLPLLRLRPSTTAFPPLSPIFLVVISVLALFRRAFAIIINI